MSLATRCTACGTVFRVVQDQLKVSSGWVRCGRCGEVFNAIESLVDVALERPEPASPTSVHGPRVMAELARLASPGHLDPAAQTADVETEASSPTRSNLAEAVVEAPAMVADPARDADEEPMPHARPKSMSAEPGDAMADVPAELPTTAVVVPGFVHRAVREARWRHPVVRGGLAGLSLVAGAALGLQMVSSHHDWIAARWPVLRSAVVQACQLTGCQVVAPRHLAALAVESSSLQRQSQGAHFVLNISLRNRAPMAVRMPAMDLVLTDASGRPAVRRVMTPQDFGGERHHIEAGANESLTARIQVQGQPILGYTVELFYP